MKKSFRFDFEDYIAGTAFLNRKEKGSYVDLLCCQAGKGRLTLQNIKDILNGDFDCWEKLSSKFIEENGMYYNRKLESVMTVKHKKTVEEIIQDRNKIEQHLKETKLKFYEDCKPYLKKYPKEMLRMFYNYWTEPNKSGTKVRFELQKCFDISRRLITWSTRDKEFNKIIKPDILITYKELCDRVSKGEESDSFDRVVVDGKAMYRRKKLTNQ